jgi:hypothetical protein
VQAALCLHARAIAIDTEHTAGFERRERAAKAVFANAIKDDVEPAREDAREVFTLIVNRSGTEFADERRMLAARGAP